MTKKRHTTVDSQLNGDKSLQVKKQRTVNDAACYDAHTTAAPDMTILEQNNSCGESVNITRKRCRIVLLDGPIMCEEQEDSIGVPHLIERKDKSNETTFDKLKYRMPHTPHSCGENVFVHTDCEYLEEEMKIKLHRYKSKEIDDIIHEQSQYIEENDILETTDTDTPYERTGYIKENLEKDISKVKNTVQESEEYSNTEIKYTKHCEDIKEEVYATHKSVETSEKNEDKNNVQTESNVSCTNEKYSFDVLEKMDTTYDKIENDKVSDNTSNNGTHADDHTNNTVIPHFYSSETSVHYKIIDGDGDYFDNTEHVDDSSYLNDSQMSESLNIEGPDSTTFTVTDTSNDLSSIRGHGIYKKGDERTMYVSMEPETKIILQGCGFLKCIIGSFNVFGYTVNAGETVPLFSPTYESLLSLKTAECSQEQECIHVCSCFLTKQKICLVEELLQEYEGTTECKMKLLNLHVGDHITVLQLRGLPHNHLGRLLSQCSAALPERLHLVMHTRDMSCYLSGGAVGPSSIIRNTPLPPVLTVPPRWSQIAEMICRDVSSGTSNSTAQSKHSGIRVMVIGARAVGKSTFIRYLLNSILNNYKENKRMIYSDTRKSCCATNVCLMELDPKKPEQAMPGVLSVASYCGPLLGSHYIYRNSYEERDTEDERSYGNESNDSFESEEDNVTGKKLVNTKQFLRQKGDVNGKQTVDANEESCRQKLTIPLCSASNKKNTTDVISGALNCNCYYKANTTVICKTSLEILFGLGELLDRTTEFVGSARRLMRKVCEEHNNEPLLVNTVAMSNAENFLMLCEVMRVINPTHVVHIAGSLRKETTNVGLNSEYVNRVLYEKNWFNKGIDTCFLNDNTIKEKEFISCNPTHVRLNYEYLKTPSVSKSIHTTSFDDKHAKDIAIISFFAPLWHVDSKFIDAVSCKLAIRIKWDTVALHVHLQDIDFSGILSAINGTIVALCFINPKYIKSFGSLLPKRVLFEHQLESAHIQSQITKLGKTDKRSINRKKRQGKCRDEDINESWLKEKNKEGFRNEIEIKEDCMFHFSYDKLFSCHGWALVKGIDLVTRELHLLTPMPAHLMTKVNVIVKPTLDLPKKFGRLFYQGFQYQAYVSDGIARNWGFQSKGRTNWKH